MLLEKDLSQKGQGMVEYALVLAFIIVIGAVFVRDTTIGQAISGIAASVTNLFVPTQ